MPQTIMITGASSGIGRATAAHFADQGWNVIATMRRPEDGEELAARDNVLVARLDVTESASIAAAVEAGIERFGKIDVLVNNAGYGAFGVLETFSMDAVKRQFDTNVIGLIETTKALIPHFRANKSGMFVNVSSVGGKITFPLGSLYHGTKFAVEGISEALHYEMAPLGVTVKIIEPGGVKTDFAGRSLDLAVDPSLTEYEPIVTPMMAMASNQSADIAGPGDVAEVIFTAVTDGTDTLRYRGTHDAHETLDRRASEDDATYFTGMKQRLGIAA